MPSIWPSFPAPPSPYGTAENLANIDERAYEHRAWRRTVRDVGDCHHCGRTALGVHIPALGDGSVYWTHWHKHPDTGTWCRSELPAGDVRQTPREPARPQTRHDTGA